MTKNRKIVGGVIMPTDQPGQDAIELLTYRLRKKVELIYYARPTELGMDDRQHDFILVLSLRDLADVVQYCRAKRRPVPLMVHIDEPYMFRGIDYERQFPGVEVVTIEHALFSNEPDTTLKLRLFSDLIERLEAARV